MTKLYLPTPNRRTSMGRRSSLQRGVILLVAMIGAIVLTMRHRRDIKRQNVLKQMWTDPKKQLELRDVKPGQGL